ncbi:hypothetical protein [Mesorhizobium sp. WSM2239]|jgi:hypothetical protein|uniref:CBS domain-containing protein n=2 Tax=unclassified Mesorhizobium TaxID=325217 RepID=A0AAU8D3L3_9HYPH
MPTKNVMVLVDEQHRLDSVATAVRECGVRVERVMRGMRTIVGAVSDDSVIQRVQQMDGVASVREEETFAVPPSHRDIPQ